MQHYSVQPKNRIFVKGYGFLSFAENMGRNIGKNIKKPLVVNKVRKFLIMLNNLLKMHLKQLQKETIQKQQKQLVILLVIKSLTELQKFRKLHQKRIQMKMKEKYLETDLYLQN